MHELFTVYDHPADFPSSFVVRLFWIDANRSKPGPIVAQAATLDDVRQLLLAQRPQLACLPRDPSDDPVIVECWI